MIKELLRRFKLLPEESDGHDEDLLESTRQTSNELQDRLKRLERLTGRQDITRRQWDDGKRIGG